MALELQALNSSPTGATIPFPRFKQQRQENQEIHERESLVKKKRSKRPRIGNPPTEEEYLALCLIMLSQSNTNEKINISESHDQIESSSSQQQQPLQSPPSPVKLNHKCSVCDKAFPSYQALVVTKPATVNLHQKHQHFPLHYQLRIAGDDDDFGGVRMEKFLAGRRRVKHVFDGSD